MIDWTTASDDELGEIYDALYERNNAMSKALDQIHMRLNIGSRSTKLYQCYEDLLLLSNELSQAIHEEVKRRHLK